MRLQINYIVITKLIIICFLALLAKNSANAQFEKIQSGTNLPITSSGHVAWGDYNNDGLLDVLFDGDGHIEVIKNNGNGSFSHESGFPFLDPYGGGDAAWGDYNNDGRLDILLTGTDSYVTRSIIYKNNADSTFTEQTGITLTGVYENKPAWGDYNNDGYLDILLTGSNGSSFVKNEGSLCVAWSIISLK